MNDIIVGLGVGILLIFFAGILYLFQIVTKPYIIMLFGKKRIALVKEILKKEGNDKLNELIKLKLTDSVLIQVAQEQIKKENGGKNVKISSKGSGTTATTGTEPTTSTTGSTTPNYYTSRFGVSKP